MKQRILYLDIIRVLACIMVICMHAPMPWSGEGEVPAQIRAFMVYSSYWTLPCVCLFFAVSGALLLPAKIEPSDSRQWLKKRLNKVIWPTLIWTSFYLVIGWINNPEIALGGGNSSDNVYTILPSRSWNPVVYVHTGGSISSDSCYQSLVAEMR